MATAPTSQPTGWKHPLAKLASLWQSTRIYHVSTTQVIANPQASTVAVPQFVASLNWPAGNIVYKKILIRISGTANIAVAAGNAFTIVPQGMAKLIQSLYLRFSNLDYVVNGLDGLTLFRMLNAKLRKMQYSLDFAPVAAGASNPANPFELLLEIPLQDPTLQRPEDTGVDMLIAGSPTLTINWQAVATALGSISGTGNTFNLNTLQVEIDVEVVDPPNGAIALPLFKPFFDLRRIPIVQSGPAMAVPLPFNDRRYERIFLSQRDGVTLAELADTIIGVNPTDKLSLALNNDNLWNQENYLLEEHRQQANYGTAVNPAGSMFLDFLRQQAGGSRIGDAINVETSETGNLTLYADVTLPAGSPQLVVGMDCVQTLKPEQKRAANLY